MFCIPGRLMMLFVRRGTRACSLQASTRKSCWTMHLDKKPNLLNPLCVVPENRVV
jgi:hypothetical protein